MAMYGTLPHARPSKRQGNGKGVAALIPAVALVALLAVVSLQRARAPTELAQKGMETIVDEAGHPVQVPSFAVNYAAGTTYSAKGEFSTSASDKAVRTQQLAEKPQKEKWVYDYQMNSVQVPQVKVDYKAGTTVSPSGEFDYSAMDKAVRTQQLAQKSKKEKWVYDYQMNSVAVPQVKVDYKAGTTVSPSGEFDYSAMDKAPRTQQLAQKGQTAFDYSGRPVQVPSFQANFQVGTTASQHSPFENSAMDKAAQVQQLAQKGGKWTASKAANDFQNYFHRQQLRAKQPRVALKPVMYGKNTMLHANPKHGLSGAAANAQIGGFFDAVAHSKYGANNHHLNDLPSNRDTKFERQLSSAAAHHDFAQYFNKAAPHAEKATKQSLMASKKALNDMNDFYKSLSQSKRGFSNHALKDSQGPKSKRVMSDAVANQDIQKYWSDFSKATVGAAKKHEEEIHKKGAKKAHKTQSLEAENSEDKEDEPESENAKQVAGEHYKPTVHCKGGICADDMLDKPLWAKSDGTVGDVNVPVEKSACQEDMDCESSRSPLLYKDGKAASLANKDGMSTTQADKDIRHYFKKEAAIAAKPRVAAKPAKGSKKVVEKPTKFGFSGAQARKDVNKYFKHQTQKLSAYGVGVEEDNYIEVGKAIGVDAQNEESVFEANPAPEESTIDEVNEAIQAQRNEGYSNGNGEPAEDLEMPP